MNALFKECRAARVPRTGLAALAPLRRLPDLQIVEAADSFWVQWQSSDPQPVIESLLPIAGVVFYCQTDGNWRPIRGCLPDFAVPIPGKPLPLDRVMQPAPFTPLPVPRITGRRVDLSLAACQTPRPASALRCDLDVLAAWCEDATTAHIERLHGALCDRRVWLRGEKLPWLPRSERFWGDRVLAPLGQRPDPDWTEGSLRQAALVEDNGLLVLTCDGSEIVPLDVFRPLTRAAVRRAWLEASSVRE